MRTAAAAICLGVALQFWGGAPAHAQIIKATGEDCGSLENAFGPFDYRDPRNVDRLDDVNTNHMHRVVSGMQDIQGSRLAINNIDYMLRAFPNHPLVLRATMEYFLRGGKKGEHRSAECYFDRAVRFTPDDGAVRVLFGVYLMRKNDFQNARPQLEKAVELGPESADAAYNLGLLNYKEKQYPQAKSNAVKAYGLGYPLPALRDNLRKLGFWDDAADAEVAAALKEPVKPTVSPPENPSASNAPPSK